MRDIKTKNKNDRTVKRFLEYHNGNVDAAIETLRIETCVKKTSFDDAIINFRKILTKGGYASPLIFKTMDNYVYCKNLKTKKEYYYKKFCHLKKICDELGIDTKDEQVMLDSPDKP